MTALTNKEVWDGVSPLNITIKALKDEEGTGGRIIISGAFHFLYPDCGSQSWGSQGADRCFYVRTQTLVLV